MKTINVRGVEIGAGIPKIAVSITGSTEAAAAEQAHALKTLGADVAEWRMDLFDGAENGGDVTHCLGALREALDGMPLLATFRSDHEGGQRRLSPERYTALNESVISSGMADLLDVELFSGDAVVRRLVSAAHEAGVFVVLSNHDFEKTPSQAEMVSRLRRMQALGADILKLAVMPQSRRDVLALLSATEEMYTHYAERPLVTMSMGSLGRISRICGETFGSAMTFGAAAQSSAPGQVPARELARALALLAAEQLPESRGS